MKIRLEKWVWESCPKIDPTTGVSQVGTLAVWIEKKKKMGPDTTCTNVLPLTSSWYLWQEKM